MHVLTWTNQEQREIAHSFGIAEPGLSSRECDGPDFAVADEVADTWTTAAVGAVVDIA